MQLRYRSWVTLIKLKISYWSSVSPLRSLAEEAHVNTALYFYVVFKRVCKKQETWLLKFSQNTYKRDINYFEICADEFINVPLFCPMNFVCRTEKACLNDHNLLVSKLFYTNKKYVISLLCCNKRLENFFCLSSYMCIEEE